MIRRLSPESSMLLLCDIQDRFRPLIFRSETLIRKCVFLNESAKILGIPRLVTEHYPKALGPTVPEIRLDSDGSTCQLFLKKKFSMLTDEVQAAIAAQSRKKIILCGIEAHVCILQTALDLVESGHEVFVVSDAVSSQRPYDRAAAFQRLRDANVTFTTSESVVFDLMRTADHPHFKQVSSLLKLHNELPNEFANDMIL